MRCQKCKKFNWWYPKFCRKCGAEFARKKKHHPVLWGVVIVLIVLVAFFVFIGIFMDRKFKNALAGIQDNLVKVVVAKIAGDSLAAGKKIEATMETIETDAMTAATNLAALSVPDDLKPYQVASILWSIQVASAAINPSDWKNLKNQPNDFPLGLIDVDAESRFEDSVKIIVDLKKAGADAISNKDREAILRIGAKILVQNHWLKAILYSEEGHLSRSLVIPALAASPSGLQPIPDVRGVDVTCLVCNFPDTYKVKWTDKLRQQYGCEVRCHPETASAEETADEEQTAANDEAAEYAEALANYSYDNVPKRSICIGTGGTSTGNETTRKYCVEDAIQSTNEIAASAIGFAEGTKSLSVEQWNYQYSALELALGTINELPAQPTPTGGQVGTPPSKPTVDGGHKEGGQGTIQQGEPIATPEPTQKQGGIWDGYYKLSGNCTEVCSGGVCALANALGGEESTQTKQYSQNESIYVFKNKITRYNEEVVAPGIINSSGYAKIITSSEFGWHEQYQFTRTGNAISVKMNTHSGMTGWDINCTYTGSWVSADYPEDY